MASRIKNQKKDRGSNAMSTDDLVEWACELIRTGRFVSGQRLIESDIMRETGATRNKVREALQRLATEGLVTIEAFRGASVKSISWDEVRQIYEARMALEGFAARRFADSHNDELKDRLAQTQREMNRWVERGDHQRFAELNGKWHDLIIDAADNDYFRQFRGRLTIPVYRLLFTAVYSKQQIIDANADHKEITRAILAGLPDEAERLMRSHIEHALEALSEFDAQFF
jgi:DNA-binding GntR family transcriptional regulator